MPYRDRTLLGGIGMGAVALVLLGLALRVGSLVGLPALPLKLALSLWWAASLLALGVSCLLLTRMLPEDGPKAAKWLVVVLVAFSMPCIQAFWQGQNSLFSLMILCLTVRLWFAASQKGASSSAAFLAGAAAGLLLYKPQVALVVAAVMVMVLGRRALLGVCLTGMMYLVLSAMATPGSVEPILLRIGDDLRQFAEGPVYVWERQVTFKAFWRLLVQGRAVGRTRQLVLVLWALSTLGLGSFLLSATARHLRRVRARFVRPSPNRLIAATIAAMPLLMPFYFDYDLVLMAIPAVLLGAEIMGRPSGARIARADRGVIGVWVAVYVVAFISPLVGAWGHVQVVTALLAVAAVLHTARVFGEERVPLKLIVLETDGEQLPVAA